MFNSLIAETFPEHNIDVILMPLVYFFASLAVWYAGIWLETKFEVKNVKFAAAIPVVIGLFVGLNWVLKLRDPAYTGVVDNDRIIQMHYLSFVLPLAAIAICVAWQVVLNKRQQTSLI